jgi:protein-S-isoprenylcysteine O-methyltransferase Ste14
MTADSASSLYENINLSCESIITRENFARLGTNIKPFGQPDQFVFGGPYRFSRNPMVLGFGLILVGVWLLLGAFSPLLGVAAFIMITDRWVIPFEESQMKNKFGQANAAYCLKTGRWISL